MAADRDCCAPLRQLANALTAAGLGRHFGRWQDAQLTAALTDWTALHGRPPTARELDHADRDRWPAASVIVRRFGSRNAALTAAGLPVADALNGKAPPCCMRCQSSPACSGARRAPATSVAGTATTPATRPSSAPTAAWPRRYAPPA
jgi:Homing endonuclease associated repeat